MLFIAVTLTVCVSVVTCVPNLSSLSAAVTMAVCVVCVSVVTCVPSLAPLSAAVTMAVCVVCVSVVTCVPSLAPLSAAATMAVRQTIISCARGTTAVHSRTTRRCFVGFTLAPLIQRSVCLSFFIIFIISTAI